MTNTKVAVVGSGYVGMSIAAMLARLCAVVVLDIDQCRVDKVNQGLSSIDDPDMDQFINNNNLNLRATLDQDDAYKGAHFIIIAVPTDYDTGTNKFDTEAVDAAVADALSSNESALIVVKSTVPVGHTRFLQAKHDTDRVVFSPEFLRETSALRDNLYPSRIIVGGMTESAHSFAALMKTSALKQDIEVLCIPETEAEAIKLFANTYLAMRVSFFNELDSFALAHKLDAQKIIEGVCLDQRIGEGYNNPSFGFGGYCLPKDSKQLLSNYDQIPQTLIKAIVTSNSARQDFIAGELLKNKPNTIGIFRLVMKQGSDNFRDSAILGLIERVRLKGVPIIIYEPYLNDERFEGAEVIKDIRVFKSRADIIVANRNSHLLADCQDKVFTRDVFGDN
tara:strand:+ start:192 stop:1367 length:1176 start_codon:yes stop_codon:yes gene_type:complete